MSIPTQTAFVDGPLFSGQKALQRASMLVLGSLASAGAIFGVAMLMSSENERQAGRMLIGAQKNPDYLATLAAQLSVSQARPRGF